MLSQYKSALANSSLDTKWHFQLHSFPYQNLLLNDAFGFKMQHERKAAVVIGNKIYSAKN